MDLKVLYIGKSGTIVQFFEKIMLILDLNFIPASNILFFRSGDSIETVLELTC